MFKANGMLGYGFSGATANPDAVGVLIVEGGQNRIQANRIDKNGGDGVLLIDSFDNRVGGPRGLDGNTVTRNFENGIAIQGTGSTGNIVQSNLVGTNPRGDALGNEADGIALAGGASQNLAGGRGPVVMAGSTLNLSAPNQIAHNGQNGLRITGGATIGNSILSNSIHQNGSLGIDNEGGGNQELPPPVGVSYAAGSASGAVADVGLVPPGSVVNVFSDAGRNFTGQHPDRVVHLYRDNDGDGLITAVDSPIAGPFSYDADDGTAEIDLAGIRVEPGDPQRWIVAYATSQPVQEGTVFSLRIAEQASVDAEFLFPIGVPAVPAGPFPVASDEFTVETVP